MIPQLLRETIPSLSVACSNSGVPQNSDSRLRRQERKAHQIPVPGAHRENQTQIDLVSAMVPVPGAERTEAMAAFDSIAAVIE